MERFSEKNTITFLGKSLAIYARRQLYSVFVLRNFIQSYVGRTLS